MEKLTDRQNDVLNFIKQYLVDFGYPPTVREIGQALGLSSPATIHSHINNLEEKGYLKKEDSKNRAIELLVENDLVESNPQVIDVPLLGFITAGSPIEAIENPNEVFSLPIYMIPKKKEVFALKVSGDSMINAGIHNEDIVIIQKQNTVNNGDYVVAMTDENEVTLKTYYKENNYFRLQPENDSMPPIILKDITVLGKAIGLYRKL